MDRHELDQHLSRVSTMWTMVREAHGGGADSAAAALAELAQRYSGLPIATFSVPSATRTRRPSSRKSSPSASSGALFIAPTPPAAAFAIT